MIIKLIAILTFVILAFLAAIGIIVKMGSE